MGFITDIAQRITEIRSGQTTPTGGVGYDLGMWPYMDTTTTVGGPAAGMGVSTVYACVDTISRTVASLPTMLYTVDGDGDKYPAVKHKQYRLYTKSPNPSEYVTPYYAKRQVIIDYLLWGNGYQIKIVDANQRASAYVSVDPWDMIPFRDQNRRLWYQCYKMGYEGTYSPDRVIHLRDMGYGDIGSSKISLHAITIGKEKAAAKFINQFYTNGMFLGGFVKYPEASKDLTPDQVKNLRENFQKQYGGIDKSGKVGVLTGGADFQQFKMEMPLSNAQYVEGAKLNKAEIASIFNVPLPKIGYTEGTPYNSLESLNTDYYQNCILPLVTMYEQEVNLKAFAPGENVEIGHNFESLLIADTAARGEYFSKMFRIGVLNRDEIRNRMNLNKIPQGTTFFIEGNNMIPAHLSEQTALANIKSKENGTSKIKPETKSDI